MFAIMRRCVMHNSQALTAKVKVTLRVQMLIQSDAWYVLYLVCIFFIHEGILKWLCINVRHNETMCCAHHSGPLPSRSRSQGQSTMGKACVILSDICCYSWCKSNQVKNISLLTEHICNLLFAYWDTCCLLKIDLVRKKQGILPYSKCGHSDTSQMSVMTLQAMRWILM